MSGIYNLKNYLLYNRQERGVGNNAKYLFLVPVILRKEAFEQLQEYITAEHLGRTKTYNKKEKGLNGVTCIKTCHIDAGFVLPVVQDIRHIDMQKHVCFNTILVKLWNILGKI